MNREVKHLFVRFSTNKILCSCTLEEQKVCPERAKNNYECVEAIVSIAPVSRGLSIDKDVKTLEDGLKKISNDIRTIKDHSRKLRGL